MSGRRRERGPWPHLREATLTAALEADGKVLDAGQRATVQLLTGRKVTRGVYLHGGVGRGKTWMGAEFFNALEVPKLRLHMHALLGQVNQVVASAQAGQPIGIDHAVARIVGDARLVFIDEFHVHDVGDAMLLRRVLPGLLALDAGLLLTSNYPADGLLPDPLFHHTMVPVIEMIQSALTEWRIPDGVDYRPLNAGDGRGAGFASGSWTVTGSPGPTAAGTSARVPVGLRGTRQLEVASADPEAGELVATFGQLCGTPVSVQDFLGLARTYSRWHLLAVPRPEEIDVQAFQRLAFLVDVLVDTDLRLDVQAALPLHEWVRAAHLPRDADRFLSRLSLLGGGRIGITPD
ncbi:cell division protein ZapE [Citricoccus nitrophenolicus]|uniref:Cell division protein ZapE n=1 Tax=Citricoccus muralis TaxID=169134 RepID=A0A3D9L858_9MICC|nr:AFG1/ZapE family ATPase [Citricoccus muralis]REE02495.1 cell division protein ZapE [Citricoccus muralis]